MKNKAKAAPKKAVKKSAVETTIAFGKKAVKKAAEFVSKAILPKTKSVTGSKKTVSQKAKAATSGKGSAPIKKAAIGSKKSTPQNAKASKSAKSTSNKKPATSSKIVDTKKSGIAAKSSSSSINKKSKGKKPATAKKSAPKAKQVSKPVEKPIQTPVLTHGSDGHFIPAHKLEMPARIEDGKKVEKVFHQREEVALHQENQKVKAAMASRMGRKRVFHTPRFS